MAKPIDESNIGIILWVVLIVVINAMWIGMDWWLHSHGHEYLTTELHEALHSSVWAAVVCFLVGGTVSAFCWHMFVQR